MNKTLLLSTLLFGLVALMQPLQANAFDGETDAEVTAAEMEDGAGDEHADESSDKGHDDGSAAHGQDDHSGGHGHAADDSTHSNMSDSGLDAAEWRSEKAIATLIVFGLLLVGLRAFAWGPIAAGLENRERTIADNIANAERASADAEAKLAEYDTKLAQANEEAQNILAAARKDAEATGQKLVAEAQEEAVRLRERAEGEIESAKRVALGELADQSSQIAMTLAQRIVGREVKADDHQGLIQEMLQKLPSDN